MQSARMAQIRRGRVNVVANTHGSDKYVYGSDKYVNGSDKYVKEVTSMSRAKPLAQPSFGLAIFFEVSENSRKA
jgi:hypothetical protein